MRKFIIIFIVCYCNVLFAQRDIRPPIDLTDNYTKNKVIETQDALYSLCFHRIKNVNNKDSLYQIGVVAYDRVIFQKLFYKPLFTFGPAMPVDLTFSVDNWIYIDSLKRIYINYFYYSNDFTSVEFLKRKYCLKVYDDKLQPLSQEVLYDSVSILDSLNSYRTPDNGLFSFKNKIYINYEKTNLSTRSTPKYAIFNQMGNLLENDTTCRKTLGANALNFNASSAICYLVPTANSIIGLVSGMYVNNFQNFASILEFNENMGLIHTFPANFSTIYNNNNYVRSSSYYTPIANDSSILVRMRCNYYNNQYDQGAKNFIFQLNAKQGIQKVSEVKNTFSYSETSYFNLKHPFNNFNYIISRVSNLPIDLYSFDCSSGKESIQISCLDKYLNLLWQKNLSDIDSCMLSGTISGSDFDNSIYLNVTKYISNSNYRNYVYKIDGFSGELLSTKQLDNNQEEEKPFAIYPSPVRDIIRIQSLNNFENMSIRIVNQLGQVVFNKDKYKSNEPINIQHLSAGIYYLDIFSSYNMVRYSEKFIKE